MCYAQAILKMLLQIKILQFSRGGKKWEGNLCYYVYLFQVFFVLRTKSLVDFAENFILV